MPRDDGARAPTTSPSTRRSDLFWILAGIALLAACGALTGLSYGFVHGEGYDERPLVTVFGLLAASGAVYFIIAVRSLRSPPPLVTVLAFALLLRAVLLPSTPIQEDDVYRYLWDGKVVAAGIDPYLVSPEEVLGSGAGDAVSPHVGELARLRDRSAANRAILDRINHRDYVTIYPAFAQWIFGLAGLAVPHGWSVTAQVTAMKTFLSLFDIGTIGLLVLLLRRAGLPAGLVVLYAWCPLVLKEIHNSGHMDSVPVFFVVLALFLTVVAAQSPGDRRGIPAACLAGASLAAATGAKLFAVILLPLLALWPGLRRGGFVVLFWSLGSALFLFAYPEGAARRAETLKDFALLWEKNAAFFLWVEKVFRLFLGDRASGLTLSTGEEIDASLICTRVFCGALISLATAVLAWKTRPGTPARVFLRRCFYTLACLFLLGPLGFPWYFLWAAALLPFVDVRAWFLLPALLAVYYLRFHFWYNFGSMGFTSEDDALHFFDHVIVTAEFVVFFGAWIAGRATRRG